MEQVSVLISPVKEHNLDFGEKIKKFLDNIGCSRGFFSHLTYFWFSVKLIIEIIDWFFVNKKGQYHSYLEEIILG